MISRFFLPLGAALVWLVPLLPAAPAPRDPLMPLPYGALKLEGFLGGAIDASIAGGLKAQNIEEVLRPFRERRDVKEWRSEFWGKWITAAIPAWRYSGDEQLHALIVHAVAGLIATQTADGYIGAYPDGGHLQRWDIRGRKYTLLGLLAWHEATGDEAALTAARRQADFLLSEVGPGKASPFTRDMWNGMASGSVLEPMVLLHRRTGEQRYLDFANYLVQAWANPDGPDLLNKALAGTPAYDMFPKPKPVVKGYGDAGKSKAYEMMSNYEGLLELSRLGRGELTKERLDLSAMVREIGADLAAKNPGREVELVVADGVVADGDARLVRVLLDRLLCNAWKFTAQTGKPLVEFYRTDWNGRPAFAVRDNGAGFDPHYADKLFAPFQRLHSQQEFPGVGIGLAIAKRIVSRHDGMIKAEGEPGKGATLTITL